MLEKETQLAQITLDNSRKAVAAGAKMSFGTDAAVCPFGTSGKQFAFMVKYGMTPMQAIQAATSNAADLLGHSTEFGSIKPGKYADIIAVTGDPAHRHSSIGKRPVRDERRQGLQTMIKVDRSVVSVETLQAHLVGPSSQFATPLGYCP